MFKKLINIINENLSTMIKIKMNVPTIIEI